MDRTFYDPFSYDHGDFGTFTIAEGQIGGLIDFLYDPLEPENEAQRLVAIKSARNVNLDMDLTGDETIDRFLPWNSLKVFCEELVKNCKDMLSVKIIFNLDEELWGLESRIASARAFNALRKLPSNCVLDLQGLDDETYQLYWKGITDG